MNKELLEDFVVYIDAFNSDKEDIVKGIIRFLRKRLEIFSIAIRIKDGEDFPFYTTLGLSDKFIKMENFLCERDDNDNTLMDNNNKPKLSCMCGCILSGKTSECKQSLGCFTNKGSFYTNSVNKLIENSGGDIGIPTRGTCVESGYKSIAIIPIKYKNNYLGLVQLNDFEENKFDKDTLETMEQICDVIGCVLGPIQIQEKSQQEQKIILKNELRNILKDLKNLSESILKKNGASTTQ